MLFWNYFQKVDYRRFSVKKLIFRMLLKIHQRIYALREEYLKTIDQVIPFLQGKPYTGKTDLQYELFTGSFPFQPIG
jgi:hypothetical protein